MAPKVVVVGSLNVDHSFRVARIPQKGETLMARDVDVQFGGKGANQALAAARSGANVWLIGCVGNDDAGRRYRIHLEEQGIHTNALFIGEAPTGSACIAVEEGGNNTIIVHPGANACLTSGHILECDSVLRAADVVVVQLECPIPTVICAVNRAKSVGAQVVANLSPFDAGAVSALRCADTWVVNETELGLLTGGICVEQTVNFPRLMSDLGCEHLVVTRGADPTLVVGRNNVIWVPPPKVTPVDTVGAGDAFTGAFAVALAEGKTLLECVLFANAAGALATQERGAQISIPRREEILKML